MKPKHFPFCVVKPLTDEVSTSEQKMNPKREHFSCREKGSIKIYETVIKERDISHINLNKDVKTCEIVLKHLKLVNSANQ